MMQQTSLVAFDSIKPGLGTKQEKVLNMLISLEVANNTILARKLGWPINTVTPRVAELRDKGLVIQDSIRDCPITHKDTIFWRVRFSSGNIPFKVDKNDLNKIKLPVEKNNDKGRSIKYHI